MSDMARRIGSESDTTQAQEIISVWLKLPAFVAETMYIIGSGCRPYLFIGLVVRAKSVRGIGYLHCASFDPYQSLGDIFLTHVRRD